jgi:hypothetical protein
LSALALAHTLLIASHEDPFAAKSTSSLLMIKSYLPTPGNVAGALDVTGIAVGLGEAEVAGE